VAGAVMRFKYQTSHAIVTAAVGIALLFVILLAYFDRLWVKQVRIQ
jgi:hypothetical protein